MPELGAGEAPASSTGVGNTAPLGAEQVAPRRFGIWDLGTNVLRLQGKLSTIDEVDRRTMELQQTFTGDPRRTRATDQGAVRARRCARGGAR